VVRQGKVRSGRDKTHQASPGQDPPFEIMHAAGRHVQNRLCGHMPSGGSRFFFFPILLLSVSGSPEGKGMGSSQTQIGLLGTHQPGPTASQHHHHYHHLTIRPDELRHSKCPLLLFPSLTANTPPSRLTSAPGCRCFFAYLSHNGAAAAHTPLSAALSIARYPSTRTLDGRGARQRTS
jgi:hypothetical protein